MPTPSHQDRVIGMRRETELRCALALRDGGPAGVSELSRATGLSRPTIDTALVRLIARGLVAPEVRSEDAARTGRPPRLHRFVGEAAYIAGVDARADTTRVAIADLSGLIVARVERDATVGADAAARLQLIAGLVGEALALANIAPRRLRCALVAVPGVVGVDGRVVASEAFVEWEGLDIAGRLEELIGCSVVLDNDIKLAALAEHRWGAARLAQDVLFFHIGSKVSSGMVLDGRLRRGRHNAAGELNRANMHLPLDEDGFLRWSSAPDGRSVLRAAGAGDPDAVAERDAFVEGLATLIALFAQGIDPDCVVVGGPLSQAGDVLLAPLREAVARRTALPFDWQILASALGRDVILLGALSRAYELSSRVVYDVDDAPPPVLREPDAGRHAKDVA